MENIINKARELFFARLEEKTNWGKEILKRMFDECLIQVMSEYIANKEKDAK